MSTLRFFKPDEFAYKYGCGRGCDDMDAGLLRMLDEARTLAGIPFSLSSAFRCTKHNKAVSGVADSVHTHSYAVDIKCTSSHYRFRIISALLEAGFRRIEAGPTWVHVDNDPAKPQDVIFYAAGRVY